MNRNQVILGAIATLALGTYGLLRMQVPEDPAAVQIAEGQPIVSIELPALNGNAAIGARIFEGNCVACHGESGVGKEGFGPPLIHKIYEPSHHADEAFQRAVANGVRGHHWRYGDMPPVEGLTRGDVKMIVDYIRTIQRANGIN